MAKSLVLKGEDNEKLDKVKSLLNESFTWGSKLFRISTKLKPEECKSSVPFKEKFEESRRINILSRRMACQIFEKPNKFRIYGSWREIKSSYKIFEIGSLKDYFRKEKEANIEIVLRTTNRVALKSSSLPTRTYG